MNPIPSTQVRTLLVKRAAFGLVELETFKAWLLTACRGLLVPERIAPLRPLRFAFATTPLEKWHEWLTFNRSSNVVEVLPSGKTRPVAIKRDSWGEVHFARKTRQGQLEGSIHNNPQGVPYRGRFEVGFDRSLVTDFSEEDFGRSWVELVEAVHADYGFVTSEADYRHQNYVEQQHEAGGTASMWVGENLIHGIPGLYWLNVWPRRAEALLRNVDSQQLGGLIEVEVRSDSVVLKRTRGMTTLTSQEGIADRQVIKNILGNELFCNSRRAADAQDLHDPFE